MELLKTPLQKLNKQNFDKVYEEALKKYEDNFDLYPLPMKEEILNIALQSGEITSNKYMELKG